MSGSMTPGADTIGHVQVTTVLDTVIECSTPLT